MKLNPMTLRALICGLGMMLALGGAARAAQDEAGDETPAPPDITESETDSGVREGGKEEQTPPPPRVQTRQEYGQTITEYSRGGRVFMMTVKPRNGPTQYWEDPDGDGEFQRRTSDNIDETINLPKWRLGGW